MRTTGERATPITAAANRSDVQHLGRARRSIGRGAVGGSLAWLIGYLATYVGAGDRLEIDLAAQLLSAVAEEPVEWKLVGWAFFNAHGVDVRVPGVGPLAASRLTVLPDDVTAPLALVPPLLLVAGGAAVALVGQRGRRHPARAAGAGATVAVGYLVWCVAGLFAFTVAVRESTVRVDPVPAVVVAGLLYPAVFGAVGGVLAELAADRLE